MTVSSINISSIIDSSNPTRLGAGHGKRDGRVTV